MNDLLMYLYFINIGNIINFSIEQIKCFVIYFTLLYSLKNLKKISELFFKFTNILCFI